LAQEASNQSSALAGDVAHRAEQDYHNEYKNAVQLQGLELANQLTAEETRAKGALSQVKGKDAIEARDKTLKEYDQYFQKLTKDVTNPDVKQLAQEHYASRRNTLDGWATPYALGQREEYDNNELLSSIKNEADSAATDPSPSNVAVSVLSQKLAIQEFGERNGRGPDWVKAKQLEASSATHLSALKSIVDAGQNLVAKEFFDRNKAEFVGNDVGRAEELVKAGSSLAAALEVRDKIFSVSHEEVKGKDGAVSIKSTAPAITEAQVRDRLDVLTKGMDAETRIQAERLTFAQWHQEREIQKATDDQSFEEAARIVDQGGIIPRSQYLALPFDDRRKLDQRMADNAKPPRQEDDPEAYLDWKMKSDQAKLAMSKKDLLLAADRSKFTAKTVEKMFDEIETLRRRDDKENFKWSHDDAKKVFEAAQQTGLFGLTGSSRAGLLKGEQNINVMKFMKAAEAQFTVEAAGKALTLEKKDEIIDTLLKDQDIIKTQEKAQKAGYQQYFESFGRIENRCRPPSSRR
jgi:hypothetical protein